MTTGARAIHLWLVYQKNTREQRGGQFAKEDCQAEDLPPAEALNGDEATIVIGSDTGCKRSQHGNQ